MTENLNMKGLEGTDFRESTFLPCFLSVIFISIMHCKVLGMHTSGLIASVISLKNFLITFDCKSGSVL